jgi:alpha-pyrone synthase
MIPDPTVHIAGIGTALPPFHALQSETAPVHAALAGLDPGRTRTLRALYRKSGVRTRWSVLLEGAEGDLMERQRFYKVALDEGDQGPTTAERMAIYETWAPRLASTAAHRALGGAGVAPGAVTHLVTVSCTGFASPGFDIGVIEALGLPRGVERTQVGFMGCHAALNGVRAARGFCEADPHAVALVVAVELCSLHFAYEWNPDLLVANALFGDGAAAMVVGSGPREGWGIAGSGTVLLDDCGDEMTWRIGDHGFLMTLSPRVPDTIRGAIGPWIRGWLRDFGMEVSDVASWAVHPGGPRILEAVEEGAGFPRSRSEVSRAVLAEHGNMSSATILFILDRLRASRAPLPCVALAFGPGLTAEAALFV